MTAHWAMVSVYTHGVLHLHMLVYRMHMQVRRYP